MIPFLDLQAQYQAYKREIDTRIQQVLTRNDFILGQDVKELEKRMGDYTGTHAVAVSSGTDSLMIPMYAMELQEGDEVITTPFTFFATAEVIAFLKLKPVFVDVDPDTCNINVSKIESAVTPKTKGIISVSLFGQTPDLDAIQEIADRYGLFHIEDAAQSFGALYKGRKSCGITPVSSTSFFPAKPLGTYGDGGMMFFKDKDLADKCASIVNQGQTLRYHHQYIGVNARFDTLKAAVLMVKLDHYENELKIRQEIADRYLQAFVDTSLIPLKREAFTDKHAWAQFTLKTEHRDEICQILAEKGIPTSIHYPIPLHRQPAFAYLNLSEGSYPIAESLAKQVFSLPMHAFLNQATQKIITNGVLDAIEKKR